MRLQIATASFTALFILMLMFSSQRFANSLAWPLHAMEASQKLR